jgi:hypothetical protein
MLKNEAPYLSKPEILEFPNQTWTAQDLRKANIFDAAAFYCTSNQQKHKFRDSAESFYLYVTQTLATESSLDYTRIQALLMQNSGYTSWFRENNNFPSCIAYNTNPQIELNHSVVKLLLNKTLSLNIKHELEWLRKRSAKINKILKSVGLH